MDVFKKIWILSYICVWCCHIMQKLLDEFVKKEALYPLYVQRNEQSLNKCYDDLWNLQWLMEKLERLIFSNPFHATVSFHSPRKKSVNLWFSDVFRGCRKRPATWNGLTWRWNHTIWNQVKGILELKWSWLAGMRKL